MKKKFNVLIALLILVVLLSSTNIGFAVDENLGSWETKTSMPTARPALGLIEANGKIYAIGGQVDSKSINTVEEYDPAIDTWTTKASMPTPRHSFGIAEVNGKIYCIGGMGSSNIVEEYDPATDTWTTKANMPIPRHHFGIAELNGKIYVIGGSGGLDIVEEYDPATDTWTTKASMPTPRIRLGVAEAGGKIYAIGGFISSGHTDTVEEYDPVTDTWTTKASMPTPRYNLGVVEANGKIYAIGGVGAAGGLDIVEEYDPEADTWKTKASMSAPRNGLGVAEANGKVYAVGGRIITDNLDTVEVFTPLSTQQAPDAPTNLTATAGDSQINLSWDAITDAMSYTIKRATTSGGPYTTRAISVTNTSYTDTDVTNGITYYYVVSAIVSGTESPNSNEASATPEVSTSPQTGSAIVVITMVNGAEKEYDLTMTEVNNFINWYEAKDNGTGDAYYTIEKDWNTGPFNSRKDYIIFDKICFFEINEY